MDKKILVIEKSQAVRNIAESLLRQNGFEVLSTETGDGAYELLHSRKIDLIVCDSEICDSKNAPLYETFSSDEKTAGIPYLILHDASTGDLGYPPESIINKPFTPNDFLASIRNFLGETGSSQSAAVTDPFEGSDIEDDLIDAALGLDQLEVADSEVMGDDTEAYRRANRKGTKETLVGLEVDQTPNETTKIKTRNIEQIKVPEDAGTEKEQRQPVNMDDSGEFLGTDSGQVDRPKSEEMSASSKIEIVTDQFGITIPPEGLEPEIPEKEDSTHDYDWFLREMQKEAKSPEKAAKSTPLPPEEEKLDIHPASDVMEPVAPGPAAVDSSPKVKSPAPSHNEAVDHFISEFKKEIAKITEESIPTVSVPEEEIIGSKESGNRGETLNWEDALDKFSPRDIKELAESLIDSVASKIAEQIVAQLDMEAVYRILKEAINIELERAASRTRERVSERRPG